MEDELSGEVDFDFFDEGESGGQLRSNSKSPSSSKVNGKPPIPTSSKSPASENVTDKHGEDKNGRSVDDYSSDGSSSKESYSSDYDSDDDRENRKSKEITRINARLPSADSGGRKNSPRSRSRSRRKSDSDSSSRSDSEDSDRGSSSAYSDGKSGDEKYISPRPNDVQKKKAWGLESENRLSHDTTSRPNPQKESSTRPKSSYKRNASRTANQKHRRRASKSVSDSGSDTDTSDSESDSDSSSESQKSNSDSEITDVSPLQSADSSPVLKRKNNKHVSVISAPKREHRPYKELPDMSDVPVHRPTEGTMEFKLLMQAVTELDSEKQKRLKASSRRVVFAPPNHSFNREKSNYSFNDMQARNIDQENERLLQEIIRKRLPRKKKEPIYAQPARRLPNSAVNRLKEQRRIERENLAFLQRLQNIRPTRGLTKNEQLNEYRKQMQYGVPGGSFRTKTPQTPSTYRSSVRSMSSTSSVQSLASTAPSACSASSRSRPQSAKKSQRDPRPAWEDRW